jgi:hypothetical protein
MNLIKKYGAMLLPRADTADVHWREDPAISRASKAIICVSLFSVIVFVSLACCLAALFRAFAN